MAREEHTQAVVDGRPVLRVRAATIEITRGPDAGRSARIERPTFLVGSGDAADLRLADSTVSRVHLRFALSSHGVHVRDEGSRNGTFLRSLGKMRLGEITIADDATFTLGQTTLSLRVDGGALDLPLSEETRFGDAIGVSPAMRHLFAVLERAAAAEIGVLLEGESGVGKEVLARAVHDRSKRREGPFVAIDCGAIPAALMESELFGHERGAFTGATSSKRGLFEEANGGTVLLDEIGELPLDMQPKLLRVLEAREVRPVGARSAKSIDVRIVAATNKNLAEASARGDFRRDLFYRLAVARVTVPPLRDRPEDVLPLARSFLRRTGSDDAEIPTDLAAMLVSYGWPGNVRELRNVVERWAHLGARDARSLFDAPHDASPAWSASLTTTSPSDDDPSTMPYHAAKQRALEAFERVYFLRLLDRAGGVMARAAELADLARPSLYRMLDRLGMRRGDD